MLNIFKTTKTQTTERKELFILGKYTFTIDKMESIIEIKDNEIIDLTIKTSAQEFEQLSESDSFEFSWAIYSPMFYARDLKLNRKRRLIISDKNWDNHEVAVYFMEHCDVDVTITLKEDSVLIVGSATIFGQDYPLEIFINY